MRLVASAMLGTRRLPATATSPVMILHLRSALASAFSLAVMSLGVHAQEPRPATPSTDEDIVQLEKFVADATRDDPIGLLRERWAELTA